MPRPSRAPPPGRSASNAPPTSGKAHRVHRRRGPKPPSTDMGTQTEAGLDDASHDMVKPEDLQSSNFLIPKLPYNPIAAANLPGSSTAAHPSSSSGTKYSAVGQSVVDASRGITSPLEGLPEVTVSHESTAEQGQGVGAVNSTSTFSRPEPPPPPSPPPPSPPPTKKPKKSSDPPSVSLPPVPASRNEPSSPVPPSSLSAGKSLTYEPIRIRCLTR